MYVENKFTNNKIESIGTILIGFICIPFIIYNFLFFIDIPINTFNSWLICLFYFVGSFFYLKFIQKLHLNEIIKCVFISILIILISLIISGYFIDYSFDGQGYHGEAIIQLANGWNPTKTNLNEKIDFVFAVINHFSKAYWISGAYLYSLTNKFESAKSINIISSIALFCYGYVFVRKWFNKNKSILISLLIAFNPITLNMILSNMLDSQIASFLFIFFILLYNLFTKKNYTSIFILFLILAYLINLKFTLVGYVIIFLFSFFFYLFFIKKLWDFKYPILLLVVIFLFSTFVLGYNTYTKNTIQYQHPFYPFKGDSSIESGHLPNSIVQAKDYATGNKIIHILKSNFASTTYNYAYNNPIKYKIPFSFTKYELQRFAFAGVMIGGYGVWYSAVVILSFLMLLFYFFKRRKFIFKDDFILYVLIVTIMVSIFINPLGYIARYCPQYYLIPFILLIFYQINFPKYKQIQHILLCILVINSALIFGGIYYNFIVTKVIKNQMQQIKNTQKSIGINFNSSTAKRILFDEYKISYHPLSLKQHEIPDTLFRSEVVYKMDD